MVVAHRQLLFERGLRRGEDGVVGLTYEPEGDECQVAWNNVLCVYYSRTGNTRAAMEEIAKALGAELAELEDSVDRSGWAAGSGAAWTPCAGRCRR